MNSDLTNVSYLQEMHHHGVTYIPGSGFGEIERDYPVEAGRSAGVRAGSHRLYSSTSM